MLVLIYKVISFIGFLRIDVVVVWKVEYVFIDGKLRRFGVFDFYIFDKIKV